MALCLPRKRRAASLATRPSTLSVASITNHSCVTSAGFALNVGIAISRVGSGVLFRDRCPSTGGLLGGFHRGTTQELHCLRVPVAGRQSATEPFIIRIIKD